MHSARLDSTEAPGWAITIRLPDDKYQELTSSDKRPDTIIGSKGKSDEIYLLWKNLDSGPVEKLTIKMTRSLRESGAAWHLKVENQGDAALWEVAFPVFETEVNEDDMFVIPAVSGRLHPANEALSFNSDKEASQGAGNYPSGLLTMQCAGFYGTNGGVYIGVHDPYGSNKKLEMNCKNGDFSLQWQWPVPNMGMPGTGWDMPGDLLIRSFKGDWYDIAQIYRAWAKEKAGWWPRGEQDGRPDTPEWFKDNPVWIMSNGPWPDREPPIPTKQAVLKIKKFARFMGDLPCAVHWYNWHQVTYDNDLPHYFPADKGFVEGIKEVQAAGVHVMPYINAHVWDTDLADFNTIARPAAVKSYDGSLPTKHYAGNAFACMCSATSVWQQTVKDIVLKLAGPEFGVDGVYLDQVSAQAAMNCFDKSHGHPIGGGSWWVTQGYWPMLDDIRKSSPNTILTSESTAEPYLNRIDGYLTWVGYRDGDDAIPLFHAVYGGQVQLFGRLYKWDSWKGVAMRAKTAQALVWGEQLGWIIPDVVDDPIAGLYLKQLARLRYDLRRYLAQGSMARPPKVITDGTTITSNWVFVSDLMVTTPTVLSGAWYRKDGNALALILINPDDKPHTVTIPFNAADYGLKGELMAREWIVKEEATPHPLAKPVDASWSREITLAPMSSLAIEILSNAKN
ncbi:MAG: hypothetical protein HKN87_19830 [Saprospiraceae bacterium]|nr:hypothetical protein [Saprospiraceae bacterium]